MRISPIRLSDKTSRLHPRHVVPKPAQAYELEMPVKVREWISPALASRLRRAFSLTFRAGLYPLSGRRRLLAAVADSFFANAGSGRRRGRRRRASSATYGVAVRNTPIIPDHPVQARRAPRCANRGPQRRVPRLPITGGHRPARL